VEKGVEEKAAEKAAVMAEEVTVDKREG
jgi:hypothetical protein